MVGGLLLIRKEATAHKAAAYATPFAAGALLAAVFFDLLPEGVEVAPAETVFSWTVIGILLFFMLERGLHFFHHHRHGQDVDDTHASKVLIIVGDTVHNAIDGVVIAAGFLVSIPTGIATTLAVVAHEIPQEIGDFGLLLSKGMSRSRVILVNIMSALATFVMALITYAVGSSEQLPLGLLLGLSAGFLLYIAMSDVIPSLHSSPDKRRFFDATALLLITGVVVVATAVTVAHDLVPHDDHEAEHSSSQMHAGEGFEIADENILPKIVSLDLEEDPKEGYNLLVDVANFRFAPESVNTEPVIGEGHAHVYVNDEKIGRIYGPVLHMPLVTEGDVVRVTLNMNNHSEITHDGEAVSKTVVADHDDHHEEGEDGHHND